MRWSLEAARDDVYALLQSPTYTTLKEVERSLETKDIHIVNDFIYTDNRRTVLEKMRRQFTNMEYPTALLTGWYGSGKTAILEQLRCDLAEESLCYGAIKIDPIDIRLNEQDTLAKFLEKILTGVAQFQSEQWLVEVYNKNQLRVGVPKLEEPSLAGIVTALVGMNISVMSELLHFLEELWKEYKRATSGQRIIGIVIDELEFVTRTAEQAIEDRSNKLLWLLRIILEKGVREYIETERARRDPLVLIIFSIAEREDLLKAKWLQQDTSERFVPVERNVNLSSETAEYLMQEMLRIYLTKVVEVAAANTDDVRLNDWLAQLRSAEDGKDECYTYPIMADVRRFIAHRILVEARGRIQSFRAYQVALCTLLSEWPGDCPIDMRFTIGKATILRSELRAYSGSVNLDNFIGEGQLNNLINKCFPGLTEGYRHQLTLLTFAGITQRRDPMVTICYKDLPSLLSDLPPEDMISEKAFAEVCDKAERSNVSGWSVAGDTLHLNATTILGQLEATTEPVRPEERLKEVIDNTRAERAASVVQLFSRLLATKQDLKTAIDDYQILHIKDRSARGPLVDEFLLAFDIDRSNLSKAVNSRQGCCIGVLFKEEAAKSVEDIPFSVTVVLPHVLEDRESKYAAKVYAALTGGSEKTDWLNRFRPLINAIMKYQAMGNFYNAFKEAMKLMLLLPGQSHETRRAYAAYEMDLDKVIVEALLLDAKEIEEWIRSRLGFRKFHGIDEALHLTKVLSWAPSEMLLYPNVESVPKLRGKFDKSLPKSKDWDMELKTEWVNEDLVKDGRLLPYDSWSVERRRCYEAVQQAMGDKEMGFYEVGKLLLGDCSFNRLPKAQVSLHLFLKIGKVSPLYWKLTDDLADDYSAIKVIPRQLHGPQVLQKAQQLAEQRLCHLAMISYQCSPEARGKYYSDELKQILAQKIKLKANLLPPTIEEILAELRAYEPPKLHDRALVDRELIHSCPAYLNKLGEYLTKINDMIRKPYLFSYVVSIGASRLVQEIRGDLGCEVILEKISVLHQNWGKASPIQPIPDCMLTRICDDYSKEIGRSPKWADDFMEETERRFGEKVSQMLPTRVKDDVRDICNWLDDEMAKVIRPSWTQTYTEEDALKFNNVFALAETSARKEIDDMAKAVNAALIQVKDSQTHAAFAKVRLELSEHRRQLETDANSLAQLASQLLNSQFGNTLGLVEKRLNRWEVFKSSTLKAQEEKVDDWLRKHNLEPHKQSILDALNKVSLSVSQLDKLLRKEGVDSLKVTGDRQATPIMVIFAAARLSESLEGEDKSDSSR